MERTAVEAWLCRELAAALGVDAARIDTRTRFKQLGLDSARATALIARLSDWLERPLPVTLFWEYATVESVVRHLVDPPDPPPRDAAPWPRPAGLAAEPIAIVGTSCRFPGGVRSPASLWRLLSRGIDAITDVPADRWNADAYFDAERTAPGKMNTRRGGFIDDVDRFDAEFFGISPREAVHMDPQQRLLLELAWEALEDAAILPGSLHASATGVFVGAMGSDYARLFGADAAGIDQHSATGHDTSILAARIAYTLGLHGPALAVNTACSSSLVAVHLACQSLAAGESEMAVAGGVHLVLSPLGTIAMTKFGALSTDGACKAFDARANGYVRGEGGGLVVLKRLSRAVADGDRIRGVVLASAVNNDGWSNGLTAPNPKAQEEMLRAAYARAGIDPRAVAYVETHGPGTLLGDPIEARALGAVLGAGRPADRPLRIGSIKTNLGHTEAAAGIAGLLKVLLALEHDRLPPSLHFETPNPHIDFESLRLEVQTALGPWPRDPSGDEAPGGPPGGSDDPSGRDAGDPRIAGVSSFGFGGTNCHVVVAGHSAGRAELVALAADSAEALDREVAALRETAGHLAAEAFFSACRRASRLASPRATAPYRAAAVLRRPTDLALLQSGAARAPVDRVAPRIVFVCPGQGGQWPGMGLALLREEEVFRSALEACDRAIRAHTGWSVVERLAARDAAALERTDVVQPILFAMQVAIARLWERWGIRPDALVGFSQGEIAAAHLAGILSLEDAARVVCARSAVLRDKAPPGGMLSVPLPADQALAAAAEEGLVVAAYSGPTVSVLSGDAAAIERALRRLDAGGVRAARINVDYASHSAAMEPLAGELLTALAGVAPRPAAVRMVSTVRGGDLAGPACDPAYWVENLRQPVRFQQAVERLGSEGPALFVELGPHPVLVRSIESMIARGSVSGTAVASCRRDRQDERGALLESLAALFTHGAEIRAEPPPPALLFPVSAKTETALRAQADRLRGHLEEHPDLALEEVAASLTRGRTHFEHRAAVVASERAPLLAALAEIADGRRPSPETRAVLGRDQRVRASGRGAGDAVFVFPGQGSQWPGMALGLLDSSRLFRENLEDCERALARHVDWSLLAVLSGRDGAPPLDRVDVVQPVLFSVMVSLAALWRSFGVEPRAVVGHSQGEIAAAHVAGALSLEDAALVVALRSRALTRLAGTGGMASVERSVDRLRPHLARFGDRLAVAAVNSPTATIVSGDGDAVDALLAELGAEDVFARRIRVDYASHSARVDAVREELLAGLASLQPRRSSLPLYSTVTAATASGTELDADYWFENLRRTVRFADATESLARDGFRTFVEISPHPVLTVPLHATLERAGAEPIIVGSLRRDDGDLGRLLCGLGELYTRGFSVDGARLQPAGRRVDLPTYAFQRERYWLESPRDAGADVASAGLAAMAHPLLGAAVPLADRQGVLFTGRLSLTEQPWLAGHQVFGQVLLPGTAFVELALAAAHRVGLDGIEELTLETPLALPAQGAVCIQLTLGPVEESGRRSLGIHARPESSAASLDDGVPWTRHATGALARASVSTEGELAVWPPPGATPLPFDGLYPRLAGAGLSYGAAFQGLRAVWRREEELFAEVSLPDEVGRDAARFAIHPALLDAALHALGVESIQGAADVALPFAWRGVSVRSVGAGRLRVRVRTAEHPRTVSITVADAAGEPLARIDGLECRPVSPEQLRAAAAAHGPALLRVDWIEMPMTEGRPTAEASWALLGPGDLEPPRDPATRFARYASLAALNAALDRGAPEPDVVVALFAANAPGEAAADAVAAAHRATAQALGLLQAWLADERFAVTPLVLLTRRAVATHIDEGVGDLVHAPLWGLARSAQTENPARRLYLVDIDHRDASRAALVAALAEPGDDRQLALRDGRRLVPRLARPRAGDILVPPEASAWRLDIPTRGAFEELALRAHPEATAPLGPGQVRIAVRAAGLNFRDVLDALGMYPGDPGPLGAEAAGVVTEVGPDVAALAVGDRVMGLAPAAFGPTAVADARTLLRIPTGWSFAEAASASVGFLTAYYALVDLAHLQPGERILIHAAAGGVGMAATQLARQLGAEVFATASPAKWDILREQGFDEAHLASSRTLAFEHRVRTTTAGAGVDVVLDCLAHEFVDASLRLLPRGGRFIEMGKTDVRDPGEVARTHAGVVYTAFDLFEAGPDRIQQMLAELGGLFHRGVLRPVPSTCWDVRRAPAAFRAMARATHSGKHVLTMPRPFDPEGTVLLTGGTGALGARVARHLVQAHGARHLLLVSRQGGSTAAAHDLRRELRAAGARVTLAGCDVADRDALRALLDSIPAEHPLTAVVHAAGALDDGVLDAMTPERIGRVFAPKVDAAVHLDELTRDRDLAAFVLFSSLAGVLGNPGQSNYAAANAFLDALAQHRRARGLSATSLAWGYWSERSGLTHHLGAADLARLRRGGFRPLSTGEGLALLDAALERPEPALVLAVPDRSGEASDPVPPILRSLVGVRPVRPAASAAGSATLAQRLRALPPAGRERAVRDLVIGEVVAVLRLPSAAALHPDRALAQLGLDSLMAVELRNRLAAASGLRLQSSLLFDYPTVDALTGFLLSRIDGARRAPASPRLVAAPPPVSRSKAVAEMNARELIALVLGQSASDGVE